MFLKLGSLLILNFILKNICCEDILQKVISNPVLSSNRENLVVFSLSTTSSKDVFAKLLNAFMMLEKQLKNTFIGDNYELSVNFGGRYNKEFKINDVLNETYSKTWCLEIDKCYEKSIVEDAVNFVSQFVPEKKQCPTTVLKEFTLIISDACLRSLNNKEISQNDIKDCSMKYRNIALMLPTKDDVEECRKQILAQSNELYIDIFSSELDNNIIKKYSDMNVIYSSTMAKSKINLIALLTEYQIYIFNLYYFPFELRKGPLCETGSIIGYFQYMTPNVTSQRSAFITASLNYENNSYLIETYQNEIKKTIEKEFECPEFINEFLISANSMPSDHEQYNIIVTAEKFANCVNTELFWNNTNRHLEIIILYDREIQYDYSKYITFPNNSLNHYSFYDPGYDGVKNFWDDTTICESESPARELNERFLVTTTTDEGISGKEYISKNWVLIGVAAAAATAVIFILAIIYFCKFYIHITTRNRLSFIREKANSISSTISIPLHGKHWPLLLNDKDITIYYEKVLGNGYKSNVFEALLTQTNAFHIISTQKVAAKISTRSFDEKDINVIINELNSLVLLKEHPNIIQLKGWTLRGSVPVIITELAETNLLSFVKSSKNNYDTKLYLQILYQISTALKYLTEHKMIHRDVACRNILLAEMRIAKLADFGLSCEIKSKDGIYREDAAMQQHTRFPLKWLSIEALMDGIFSEKSDAWSFGILCYEIFSCGTVPYEDMSSHEMIEFLQSGRRLEKPVNTPEPIYDIMKNCWSQQPSNRSTFREIHAKLECLLEYYYLPLMKKI